LLGSEAFGIQQITPTDLDVWIETLNDLLKTKKLQNNNNEILSRSVHSLCLYFAGWWWLLVSIRSPSWPNRIVGV
jgi:hypothetical protein